MKPSISYGVIFYEQYALFWVCVCRCSKTEDSQMCTRSSINQAWFFSGYIYIYHHQCFIYTPFPFHMYIIMFRYSCALWCTPYTSFYGSSSKIPSTYLGMDWYMCCSSSMAYVCAHDAYIYSYMYLYGYTVHIYIYTYDIYNI